MKEIIMMKEIVMAWTEPFHCSARTLYQFWQNLFTNSSIYRFSFNPSLTIMPKGLLKREIILTLLSKSVIFSPLPSGKKPTPFHTLPRILIIVSPTNISSSCLMIIHIYSLPYLVMYNYMLYSPKVYKCLSLVCNIQLNLAEVKFPLPSPTTHWIQYFSSYDISVSYIAPFKLLINCINIVCWQSINSPGTDTLSFISRT